MPADPDRVRDVFLTAAAVPGLDRAAFLDRACAGDASLRGQVEELLAAHAATAAPDPPGAMAALAPESVLPTVTEAPRPDRTTDTPAPEGATAYAFQSGGETGAHLPGGARAGRGPGLAGTIVAGRYTLVEMIGEGGMGSVYLATQIEPVKRQVALKLIKTGTDSRAVLARFDAERQALALMDHPNIARVYDGGTTPAGQPFFVMELIAGVPLTEYCDRKRLPVRARLELFVAVCQAVQHAHQKGVIHRDLKPGNVLVAEVDGRPAPKVIDFGVAKATERSLTDISFADTGAIVGTPAYMSPEQADPTAANVDTRTDVYALGVMLYELLVGSPPIDARQFRRGAVLEMLRMVREVEPPKPSTRLSTADDLPNIAANRDIGPAQLAKALRGELDWVVMKALEKDRARRYDTAAAFARDVQRYLADEVVEARPPSARYRLGKFARRNRGPVLAAALVALAAAAGVAGIGWQWREAVDQRNKADAARADAERSARTAQAERAEADRQRDRADLARADAAASSRVAQEQRAVALAAVGKMVTAVRTELAKKPDLQGVLKNVLQIAQSSLDNIAQNPLAGVSLNDTTRAAAHDAAARMYRDLGDTPAAMREFNKAAEVYRAILDKAPDGPDRDVVKKNLVIVWISLGQTSLRGAGQADARAYYDRAAELLGRLDDKTAADFRNILVELYISVGTATIDQKPREARGTYLRALLVAQETAAQETAAAGGPSGGTRLVLQRLYMLLGGAECRVRDARSRDRYYAQALALATELLKAQPDDDGRKRLLAFARERIGDALLRANRPNDAAAEYAHAAALCNAIAAADPKNVDAQADRARLLYSLGLAAGRGGDRRAAAKHFQAALDVRKSRVGLETETYARRDLMVSLAQTGDHREAARMAETVRAKLPTDAAALVDVACCYAICAVAAPAPGVEKETRERYAAAALDALKTAIDVGYGDKVNLETEPDLDGIRLRPEFKALLDRVSEP